MRQSVVKALGIIIALILILAASVAGCEWTEEPRVLVYKSEKPNNGTWSEWKEHSFVFDRQGEAKSDAGFFQVVLHQFGYFESEIHCKDGNSLDEGIAKATNELKELNYSLDGGCDTLIAILLNKKAEYDKSIRLPGDFSLPEGLEAPQGKMKAAETGEVNLTGNRKYDLTVYRNNVRYKERDYKAYFCDFKYKIGSYTEVRYVILTPVDDKLNDIGVKMEPELTKDGDICNVPEDSEVKVSWENQGYNWTANNEIEILTEGDTCFFTLKDDTSDSWKLGDIKTVALSYDTGLYEATYKIKFQKVLATAPIEQTETEGTDTPEGTQTDSGEGGQTEIDDTPAPLLIEGFDVKLEGAKQVEGAQDEWFVKGAQDVTVIIESRGEGKFDHIIMLDDDEPFGGAFSTEEWEDGETKEIKVLITPKEGSTLKDGVEDAKTVKLTKKAVVTQQVLITGMNVILDGATQVEGKEDEWFVEGAQDVTVRPVPEGDGEFSDDVGYAPEGIVAEGGLLSTKDWGINETHSITVTATPENGAEFDEGVEGVRTVKLTRRPVPITAFVVTPEAEPEAGKYHVGKDGSLVFTWNVTGEAKDFEVKLGEKTIAYGTTGENAYSCTVTGGDMTPGQELTLGISPLLYENGKFGGGVETRCEFTVIRDPEQLGDLTAVITSAEDFEGTYILQNNTKYTLKLEYEGEIEGEPELRCDREGAISWEKINNKEFELTPVALGLKEPVKITVEIRGYAQNEPTRTAEVSVILWAETIKELTVKVNGAEAGEEVSYVGSETKALKIEWSATGDVKGYTVTCSVDGEELEGYCKKEAPDQTKMTVPADIIEAGKTLCVKVEAVAYPHGKVADDKGSREIAIHRKYEKVEGLYIKDADGKEVKDVLTVKKDADVVLSWGAQGSVDKYVTECYVDGERLEDFSKETDETEYTIPAENLPVGQTLNFSVKAVPFEGDDKEEKVITVKREVDKVSKVTVTVNGETVEQYVRVEKGTDIEIEWSADGEVAGFRTKMIVDGKEISKYSKESTQETGYTVPADMLPLGQTMTFCVTADAVEAAEKAVLDVEVYVRRDTIPVNNSIAAQLECVEKIPNLYLVRGDSIKLTWDYTGDANEVKINGQPWDPEAKEYSINISDMKIGDPSRTVDFEFCDYDDTVYRMQFAYAVKPEDIDVKEFYIEGHENEGGVVPVEQDRDVVIRFGFSGDVKGYDYRLLKGGSVVAGNELSLEYATIPIPVAELEKETEYTFELRALPYRYGEVLCENPQTIRFRVDTSEIGTFELSIPDAEELRGDVYLLSRGKTYTLQWSADGTIKDAVCTVGNSRNPLSGDDLGHGGMPIGTNRISLGEVYEASVTLTSYKEGDTRTKKIKYALLPSPVESFTVNGIDAEDGVWRVEKDKYYEISFDAAGDVKEYTVRLGNETQTVAPDETYRFSTSSMTLEERRVLTVEAVPYTYGEVNADSQSWTLSLIPDEVTDFEISALQDAVKHPLEKDGDVWVIESGKNYTLTWKYEGDARGVRAYVEGVSGDLFALGASNGAAAKSRMITADSLRLEPGKEKTLTLALTPYEGETLYREAKFALRPESVKNLGITVDGKNAANGETVALPKNASVNIGWHADNAKSLDYTTDLPQNAQSIEADGSLTVDTGRLTPGKVYSLTVQPESYAYGAIDEAASSWTVKLTLKPDEIASFEVSMPQSAEKSDGTWYLNADDATMRISATGDVESYTLNIEGRRQQTLAADAGEFDPEIASLAPGEKLRLTVTVNPMEYGDFKRGVSRTQSFTVARRPNAIADFTLTPHGVEEQPDGVYTVDSNLYFIYSYNGEAQSIELLVDDVPVDDDADGRLTINTSSWVLGQNYTVRAVAHAYEMGGDDADSQNFTLTLKPAAITKFDLTVNNKTISGDMYDVSKGKNVVLRASKTGDIRDYTISYDAATRQRPVTWYGTAFTLNSADWQLGREYTVTVTANPYPYADVETELTKTYKFRVTPATVTKFDVKQNLTRNEGNITVDVSGDIELLTVTLDGSTVYSAKPASFPVSVSIPDYDRWDFETEHKVKAVIELYENGKINRGVQSSVTLTLVRPADKVKISSVNVSGATSKNGVYLIDKNASSPALVWSISGDKKRVEVNSQRQTGSSYVLSTRGMAPGEERSVTLTVQGYGTSKDSKTVTYALKPDKLTSFSLAVDNRNATNGVWNVYRNEAVAVKWDYTGDVESVVVKLDGKTQKDVTGKQLSLNTSNWSFNEKHTVTVELKLFEHGENSVQTTKNITVQLVPREVTGAKLYVNGVEKTGNAMTVPKDKDVTLTWSVTGDPKSIKLTVDGKTEDVTDKPNFSISKTKFSDVKSTVRVTLTTTSYTGKVLTATVNLSREKICITKISSLTLGGYAEKDNDVYVFDRNADIVFKWTCDGDVKKAVIGDGVTTETVSEGGISSARHTLAGLTDRQLGNIYIYTLSLTDYSGNVKSADVKLAFKPRTVTGFSFKLDTKTYANGAEIHVPKGASKILSWSVSGEAYHYKVKIDGTQVQNSASTEYTLPIKNWTAKSSHEVEIEIVPYIYGDVKGVSSTQKLRVIVDPDAISGFKVKLNNADVPSTIELSKSDKRNLSFSVTKGDVSKVTVTLKQGSSTTDSKASLGIGDSYTLEGSKLSYGKQYTLTVTAKGLGGDEKSVSCAVVLKPEPLSNLKIKIGNSSYADGQETQITKPDKPTLDYSVSGTGASEAYRFEFKLSGSNKTYKPGDKLDTSSIDMNRYQLTLTATPVIRTSGDKVYTCTVNLVIADRFEVSYDTRQKIEASGSQLSIKGLSITKGGTKLSDDEQKNVSVVLWDVTAKKEYKKFAAKDIKWSRSIDIRLDDPKSSHSFRFDVYYNGIKVGSTGEFKIETKKPAPSYTFDRKQSWNLNSAPSNAWVIIKVDAKYSADQIETIELFISSKEKAFTSVNVKSVEVKDKDSGKYEKALLWNVKSEWSDIQKKFGKTTASISLSCKTKDGKNYGVYTLIVGVTEQELRDAGVIK